MFRHNEKGRRPASCEKCRTPAEKNRVAALRLYNEKVRKAKAAAKASASTEPTTFGEMR